MTNATPGHPWRTGERTATNPDQERHQHDRASPPLVGPATETATQWPSLSAFGKPPESLAHDNKNDLGSTAGNVQIDRWQKNGEQADQLAVILDSLISARKSYASKDRRSHDGRYPLSRETATTGGFDLEADDDLAF